MYFLACVIHSRPLLVFRKCLWKLLSYAIVCSCLCVGNIECEMLVRHRFVLPVGQWARSDGEVSFLMNGSELELFLNDFPNLRKYYRSRKETSACLDICGTMESSCSGEPEYGGGDAWGKMKGDEGAIWAAGRGGKEHLLGRHSSLKQTGILDHVS